MTLIFMLNVFQYLQFCVTISDYYFFPDVQACWESSFKDDKEMAIYDFKVRSFSN